MWVGFHDSGLMMMAGGVRKVYTTRDVLDNNEIFSIRETREGDLLIGTRAGLLRLHDQRFSKFVPKDPLARSSVFDALEDSAGRVWVATSAGLLRLEGGKSKSVIPGQPLLNSSPVTLCEGRDGAFWAGTYGKGLWRIAGRFTPHLHYRRRPFERPDPLALPGFRGHAVDRHFRRRTGRIARRALLELSPKRTAC